MVAAWFLSVILAGAGLCLGNGDLPVPECADDHGKAGLGGVYPLGVCQGLTLLGVPRNLLIQLAQAVVNVDLELGQCLTVLGENVLEVGLDTVAKGGEVGDLHHYGLKWRDVISIFLEQSAILAPQNLHSLSVISLVASIIFCPSAASFSPSTP